MSSRTRNFRTLLGKVADGNFLTLEEAKQAFSIIMNGEATPAQTAGLLMGLRVRGESIDEISGGAIAVREKVDAIDAPEGAIDTCGTGGDAKGTFNISTGAAIVAAACGVPVAKHGNRAVSSNSGSADVLMELGVNIDANTLLIKHAFTEAGIGFLMAPRHHKAWRYVAPIRAELGSRTIFNLLGPSANPAGVTRQIMGVYDRSWLEPIAAVLRNLGSEKAWVIHGSDGIDELTTTGVSHVVELSEGKFRSFEIVPEDVGLSRASISDIRGGNAKFNADAMNSMLNGKLGPIRDIVLLNASAAIFVAGRVNNLSEGVKEAEKAIDCGAAMTTLRKLIEITNR